MTPTSDIVRCSYCHRSIEYKYSRINSKGYLVCWDCRRAPAVAEKASDRNYIEELFSNFTIENTCRQTQSGECSSTTPLENFSKRYFQESDRFGYPILQSTRTFEKVKPLSPALLPITNKQNASAAVYCQEAAPSLNLIPSPQKTLEPADLISLEQALAEFGLTNYSMSTVVEYVPREQTLLPPEPSHSEKKGKSFLCVICHKHFKSSENLHLHKALHIQQKHSKDSCAPNPQSYTQTNKKIAAYRQPCYERVADIMARVPFSNMPIPGPPSAEQFIHIDDAVVTPDLKPKKTQNIKDYLADFHDCGELHCNSIAHDRPRCTITKKKPKIKAGKTDKIIKCSAQGIRQRVAIKGSLLRHMETVHSKNRPYKSDICNLGFDYEADFKKHLHLHKQKKVYQCHICRKIFTANSRLAQHIRIHTGEKPYSCKICNKSFIQKQRIIVHHRIHTGEKPYVCDICDRSFTQKVTLIKHHRTHTREKPYECETCSMTFVCSSDLTKHRRIHTGEKPYQCVTCDKVFANSSHLTYHRRTHTGNRPYRCKTCDKTFIASSHLKDHQYSHTAEFPHQCKICRKGFVRIAHLKEHQLTHTGEKTCQCAICDKTFINKSKVARHLHTVHKSLF